MSDSLRPHGLQKTRFSYPALSPKVCSNSYPSSQWHYPAISSSQPFPFNLSQHQGLFQWIGSSHQVAKVLEPQLQQALTRFFLKGWELLWLGLSLFPSTFYKFFVKLEGNTRSQSRRQLKRTPKVIVHTSLVSIWNNWDPVTIYK